MMTPAQASKEIETLINSDPLNWVNVYSIIERYADENSSIGEHASVRSTLTTEMESFKKSGDIEYSPHNSFSISYSKQGVFVVKSFLIRSTRAYNDKKSKKYEGDIYTQIIGTNYGQVIQASDHSSVVADLNPAQNPTTNPVAKKRNRIIASLMKLGSWIISNIWRIIAAVVATIIAAYLLVKLKIPH